jgi:hypothetical protein
MGLYFATAGNALSKREDLIALFSGLVAISGRVFTLRAKPWPLTLFSGKNVLSAHQELKLSNRRLRCRLVGYVGKA